LAFSNRLSSTCKTEPIADADRYGKRSAPPDSAHAAFIPAGQHLFPIGKLWYVGQMTAAGRQIHILALFLPRQTTRFQS
jgi:hypothetical protein